MVKKDKNLYPRESTPPHVLLKSEPGSLKDNPSGETICHADFSDGCVNEDTDVSTPIQEGDKNENH